MKEMYKKEYKSRRIVQYCLHSLGRKTVVISKTLSQHSLHKMRRKSPYPTLMWYPLILAKAPRPERGW